MKYSLQILSALLLASGFLYAAEPFFIGPARMEHSGSFTIDNQRFSLVHYTPAWQLSGQDAATVVPDPGYPKIEKGAFLLKGEYRTAGGKLRLEQSAVPAENGDRLDITYRISAEKTPAATQALLVSTSLPRSEFAGRPIRIGNEELILPETFFGQVLRGSIPAGTAVAFHRPDGGGNLEVFSQNSAMNVFDMGKFEPRYEIRLNAPALPAPDRPAELRVSVRDRSRGSRPLPLLAAANRGFADPVEGDGKGGWTDQGPTNDLSMLKPGTVRLGGVIFDIADPEKQDGKSCLVLTHAKDEQAELAADGRGDRYLYLLHSLAWVAKPNTLAGTLKVEYADGTDSQFEVRSGIDANDWWNPVNTPNGRIAWRFDKGKVKIGLSMSMFKLEGKPLKKLYFSSPKGVAWMIAAASTGNFPLPPGRDFPPYEIKAGKEWRPMVFEREILPGSAMDFSFLMDAPAGKHGFVTCRNGRFEFENRPGAPARFYGTNFCFGASFPDRETAELVAERLAAYGINAVRVHHQDSVMCENSKFSTELSEERMDKLDYFVYCLKKRGIYLSVDLFASRAVRKGEIPGIAGRLDPFNGAYKALVLIDPETRKNFLEFVGNWMNHVNAYTNLAWKDEPAILGMCIINEGNLDHWIKYANSAEVTRRYEAGFAQWLAKLPAPPKNGEERAVQYRRYLAQVHHDAHREMTDALRKMGVKVPLTDQNMRNWPRATLMRQDFDYVDNHAYVDHPSGAMPSRINNRSTLDSFGAPAMTYAAGRIFGKPMMITEFNWCYPNEYRFESGVLMGACAAFQDWSGIFRFAYAHPAASLLHDRSTVAFETNTDPINLLSDKIGALLFLRGDVAPAQTRNVLAVSPRDLDSETPYPDTLAPLAWLTGLGSAITAEPAPAGTLDWQKPVPKKLPPDVVGKGAWNPDRSFVRSSTGEIEFDGAGGKFRLMTGKSEVLLRPTPGKLSGKLLSAETFATPAAVAAVSVDGKTLDHSRRILFFHLTDVLNDGDVFADRRRRIYEKVGDLPHLLRQGTANIRLRVGNAAESGNATVYALSFSGRRLREVPHRFEGGVLDFTANTACSPEGVMAYEVELRR